MATVFLGWWQKILALVRAGQQARSERWVEPGNEITRAILSGAVPSLPALAPAASVAFDYERLDAAPEVEEHEPAAPATVQPPEEAVAGVAAPGRAGRAA